MYPPRTSRIGERVSSRKSRSAADVLAAILRRVRPTHLRCYGDVANAFSRRAGLEIGGPSDLFARRSLLPAYALAATIDNCNFSSRTVWTGAVGEGSTFRYDPRRPPGRQYIHEATDLRSIGDAQYDFVLASHAIEHIANPFRALHEWTRVTKAGGLLVLVVPHKEGTFDHRRPLTPLSHLIDDDRRATGEDDLTHLPEILALHDLPMDPPAGDALAFKARSERNLENRCLHHHVFDTSLVVEMTHHAGLEIVCVEPIRPYHIFLVARKLPAGQSPDNGRFRSPTAAYRAASPFATDRG